MLRSVYTRTRDALLSLTYPQECRLCARSILSYDDGVACSECWEDPAITSLLFDKRVCIKCGSLFNQPSIERCGRCEEFAFDSARAPGVYGGALKESILFLKSQPHLCRRASGLMLRAYQENFAESGIESLIPVPLHRDRRRERGFNQSELIARLIARRFRLLLDSHSLIRIKSTERHRAGLDAMDRRRSVERAFKVVRPRMIEGTAVLLIDDVLTTGSTSDATARALKEAGAARVSVLTLARVV